MSMIVTRIDLMDLAEGVAGGDTMSADETQELVDLLNGPHYWEFGVALALVFLTHGGEPMVNKAVEALEQVIDRAYP